MALFDDASLVVTPNGYKAGTLYSIKPTSGAGDMTVVRATTATRVNSAGLIESMANNVPRLDYSNGTCPSLLVEPQRTNSVLYSEQFDNAAWSVQDATITANTTTAPNGTLTADTFTRTANTGFLYSTNPLSLNTGAYSISVYAKANTISSFRLDFVTASFGQGVTCVFNLSNGTAGTPVLYGSSTSFVANIENVGNGWYRCSLSGNVITGNYYSELAITTSGSIFIWGAQLEAGSYATSYIPTTSAAVTRNADVISKTGISALIGQTEGVLFVDFQLQTPVGNDYVIGQIYNSSTPANGIYFYLNLTSQLVAYVDNTATQASISSGVLTQGRYKAALVYKANDFAFYLNGSLIGVDVSGTVPTCNSITLIDYLNSGGYMENTQINQYILFPTRLTNAELSQLTTI